MNLEKLRQAEAAFLFRFPGGFDNPEIIATRIKKHKPDQMIALARESFSKENFQLPDRIAQNMTKLVSRSSIISVFEKPRFRDYATALPPKTRFLLASGLEELLHGNERTGFETILEVLKGGKLAKWSLMTVCQTYFHPQRDVFVKPTTVKGVIEYFELRELHYQPTPSWAFYDAYRSTFHEMKSKVDPSLSPTNAAFSGFLWMTIRGEVFWGNHDVFQLEVDRTMNMKDHILAALREQFERWEGLLASLPEEEILAPRFDFDWSIKDVMAHLWAWQQISIARMESGVTDREPRFPQWILNLGQDWEEDADRLNALTYETHHQKPWSEVQQNWRNGFARFLELGEKVLERDMLDGDRYPWLGGNSLAFILVASYDHHQEHLERLLAMLSEH